MKKEWLLASSTVLVTLFVALRLVRWLAPNLLGIPADLQLVRVSTEVRPFFEGVFREEDYGSGNFIIPDPYVKRAKPLYPEGPGIGPHDILGFRNRHIPHAATLVTIGDSQTYGNNVVLEEAWPSQLRAKLSQRGRELYSMAVGGWGAIEYLEIFPKALHFKPRVVIVAFYTGNDPLESFRLAYANERWRSIRPDPAMPEGDLPKVVFPPPESEWWPVSFSDGVSTIFTPHLRLGSNQDHPAVRAGYDVMAQVALRMSEIAQKRDIRLVFTIIPTKELVYEKKVQLAGIKPPDDYKTLIRLERSNLERLAQRLKQVPDVIYVDVLKVLQEKALTATPLYPKNINGHPISAGYAVIAEAMARSVDDLLGSRLQDATRGSLRFQSAFALQKLGRREEAIRFYEEAIELYPRHDQAAFNLAYALIGRAPECLQQAVSLLEPLAQRRPDYTEVLYRLGEAYRLKGDVTKAATWYRRFLSAGGHPDLVAQAKQRLTAWEFELP